MGLLSEPLQISCVMGVTGGIRPTARNLAHMAEQMPGGADGPNNWGVIGISRDQWMLIAAALTLGGNVRVGLEDNFYLPNGEMARSNGDLIAQGAPDGRGRRPARRRRWPRRASGSGVPRSGAAATLSKRARRRPRPRPLPPAARAASARCCSPTSAPRC